MQIYTNKRVGNTLNIPENISEEEEYDSFISNVKECFPNIEITTLGTLVKNITLCASVRTGQSNRLDPLAKYYEVGMKDIDEEGVVTIEYSKDKKLGPANNYLIEKYHLKENDLLMPYRASRNYKVARVGSNYPAPLVSNSSVIRIEMYEDTPQDIAILLQTYLLTRLVKQFIIPKDPANPHRQYARHLLSPKKLTQLPTPLFHKDMLTSGNIQALFTNNMLLESKGMQLFKKSRELLQCVDKESEELLKLFLYKPHTIPPLLEKKEIVLEKLDEIINRLTELSNRVECPNSKHIPVCP